MLLMAILFGASIREAPDFVSGTNVTMYDPDIACIDIFAANTENGSCINETKASLINLHLLIMAISTYL